MANSSNTDQGIRLLVQKCRNEFRRPENIYYYSENDFKEAEKRFVKFCLTGNPNSNSGWLFSVNHKISRGGRLHSPFCFPLVKGSLCMCRLPFWLCQKIATHPCTSKKLHYHIWRLLGCSCIFSAVLVALVGKSRESINGILEATSFRGWFKVNCLLFCYIDISNPLM